MNVYVDSQVNKRNCDIQQGRRQRPETILCNPFPSFFEFKYEGKSILQSPVKFVREVAGILTMNHIGDAKARPERGRAARMQKWFYPAAWKINAISEEVDDRMDQSVHRLNLRLYSWTHFIRMGRILKRGTMQAYLLKFENLVLAGEDGTNPKLNVFELCPFCLEAGIAKYGGAEHFRIVNSPDQCCNKNIRGAILTALEAMVGTLRRLEQSIQKWKDHARICNPYDETLRDADQDAHFQHMMTIGLDRSFLYYVQLDGWLTAPRMMTTLSQWECGLAPYLVASPSPQNCLGANLGPSSPQMWK
jgi:hypothetical protein